MASKKNSSLLKFRFLLIFLIISSNIFSQANTQSNESMKDIKMSFQLDDKGRPVYSLLYKNKNIISPSPMGFLLSDGEMEEGFILLGSEKKEIDDTWKPVLGQYAQIRNHCKQVIFHLKHSKDNRFMDIQFRIFEDGLAFRYAFPVQPTLKYFIIADEHSVFNLASDNKTFWIPGDYDSNEYPYTTSKISEIDNKKMVDESTDIAVRTAPDRYSVQTPLMMKTDDGIFVNIHEAALVDYPSMQLHVDRNSHSLSSALVPDAVGNKAYVHAPFHTPWRTVIVTNKATDILASSMILNLNEPSVIQNTSWIKPMKFVGVWWEMQTGKSTWNYSDYPDSLSPQHKLIPNGKHGANTANVKRYIDFASANGIKGVLVEGWNTGWEDWFGNWKENVFDFVTPYPDFDVKALQLYAAKKGVEIIMHNETSGSATNYERQMDTAFRFMKKYGYHSVKTGYVGKIIPRGEHHDGQWMVQHYQRVAAKAASYQIMVDAHEPMRPTGLQRTYPNWLASEAARGNEYNAFSHGSPPEHETILPFTRMMGGPMDYTPGIFKMRGYTSDPEKHMHSTLAKQLALYVVFYSPIQMAADLPENYEAHKDAFKFIRDVPVDWSDSKFIEAEPGDYITTARKDKGSQNWYVGAVTDENGRTANVPLNFLDKGHDYMATIYEDAADADWQTNPEAYTIRKVKVNSTSTISLHLAKGGGAAVEIERLK